MARKETLENITSNEFLDKALQNAKKWCQENLPKYLPKDRPRGLRDNPEYVQKYLKRVFEGFDYGSLHYSIDDDESIYDKTMGIQSKNLISVSTKKLEQLQKKTLVEIDPESMFVHEIVEAILIGHEEGIYAKACVIENINRKQRGLKMDKDQIKFLEKLHYPIDLYSVELILNN